MNTGKYIDGLTIFPHEISLFDKKDIIPCWGFGKKPDDKNFEIVAYQLTKNICPHLENNLCKIYEKRPLRCRSYPFDFLYDEKGRRGINVDLGCKARNSVIQYGYVNLDYKSEEYKALMYNDNLVRKYARKKKKSWHYHIKPIEWTKDF